MLLCNNNSSSSINSMEVPILASKTMTTKKEERVVVEAAEITIRLFNNNSNHSRVVRLLNWEVNLLDSKDNSNKPEEAIQLPQVVDGRTKLVVAGAEVQPNPVAGKVKQRNDNE